MNEKNRKHRTFVFLVAITVVIMLLLPSCYGIAIRYEEERLEIDNIIDNDIIVLDRNDDNIVVLDGDIVADVDTDRLRLVRPSINLIDGQSIDFNATEIDSEKYLINRTLRINIDVINGTNDSTLLGRYITTCIILLKKNRSLASGLLGNLFVGKILNINRTNVFSEGKKYIDISLMYETNEKSEDIVMHVLAIGTMLNVAYKRIDLEFVYSSDNPQDTTPPVTICILDGKQILW